MESREFIGPRVNSSSRRSHDSFTAGTTGETYSEGSGSLPYVKKRIP